VLLALGQPRFVLVGPGGDHLQVGWAQGQLVGSCR
jgi:hypothetical protein